MNDQIIDLDFAHCVKHELAPFSWNLSDGSRTISRFYCRFCGVLVYPDYKRTASFAKIEGEGNTEVDIAFVGDDGDFD